MKLVESEEKRVGAGGVGVEVDDVGFGEVAGEEDVEDVWGWGLVGGGKEYSEEA